MNIPANAIPEARSNAHVIAPAEIAPTRLLYWALRRELWEYRSLYLAPLAVAAVFLIGFTISMYSLPAKLRMAAALDPRRLHEFIAQPYESAALMLMGVSFIVALYYSAEALHSERRDRSILFWKSLPVSDLTTVLVKASIPIVILQLITFAVLAVTHIIMLLLSSAGLGASGESVSTLWSGLPLLSIWWMMFAHLVGGHGLWYAPFYGYLML